ncbi:hypothetical protein [Halorussus marinus]|uniref:hypothetical protein n=1 Tax=Halorussus marinus TaxID=2505976 RepID=UPI0010931137|nr:hypothetical protein [Halorussus marinus]
MDRELAELRRGYRRERAAMARDAAPEPRDDGRRADETEPGAAAFDAVERADALGLNHGARCDRNDGDALAESDHDALLACWRCWYLAETAADD